MKILDQNYQEIKYAFKKRLRRNLVFSARILRVISILAYKATCIQECSDHFKENKSPRSQMNFKLCFKISCRLLGSSEPSTEIAKPISVKINSFAPITKAKQKVQRQWKSIKKRKNI